MKTKREAFPGLAKLARLGAMTAPKQISWKRAQKLKQLGFATIYPFHNRWQGYVEITQAGRDFAQSEKEQP